MEIISLGAGVQSSTMALMAAHGELGPMPSAAVFADTGWEPQEVYRWLDWLELQLPFPVYRVSAGNLRADLLAGNNSTGHKFVSVPFHLRDPGGKKSIGRRQCTYEYKVAPTRRKVRELMEAGGEKQVKLWMGISVDEITRMKESGRRYLTHRWPLVEKSMSRHDCVRWCEERQIPHPPKSSCLGCPFHSNAIWRHIRNTSPAEWADTCAVDAAVRDQGGPGFAQFMHQTLVPLASADISSAEERGQYSFLDECDGVCGV